MARNRSTFIVELIDKLSGPMNKIGSALDRLTRRTVKPATAGFDKMTRASEGAGRSFDSLGVGGVAVGNLIAQGAMRALGAIVELGAGAVGTVKEFTLFAQNSELAFNALAKHGASGLKLFDQARNLAVEFGTDVVQTTDNFKHLLAAQFNPKLASDIIAMGADLRVLNTSADDVAGAIRAITQIKGAGRLMGQELLQLANAGVSVDLVRQKLQKLLKVGSNAEVIKLQEAGKIDADTAIQGILEAIKAKTGESQLGEAGRRFADTTIEGMAGRLKARGQNLLTDLGQQMVPQVSAALGPLADRLNKFLSSKEGSQAINQIGTGLGQALDFVGKAITKLIPLGEKFFSGFVGKFAPALPGMASSAERFLAALDRPELAESIGRWGERLGTVANMLVRIGGFALETIPALIRFADAVQRPFDRLQAGASWLIGAAATWGPRIIDGLVSGLEGGLGRVAQVAKEVGSAVMDELQKIFHFGSPSHVMFDRGRDASLGLVGGMASVDVGGAIDKLAKLPSNDNAFQFSALPAGRENIGPQTPRSASPQGFDMPVGGGGGPFTNAPVFHISQRAGQSGEDLADDLDSRIRRTVEDMFEEANIAVGA